MLERAVELLCLVYHEARNVRHPVRKGLVAGDPYEALVSLPTNRDEAWAAMEKVRRDAISTGSAGSATAAFQRRFWLGLEELEELHRAPFWKSAAYGGNKWAPICGKVRELVVAMALGDHSRVEELLELISRMEHNTGVVGEKLRRLRAK